MATEKSKKQSLAVKRSWADPKVAKARAQRHHVRVGGQEYKSVATAFKEFKLPLKEHQAFRAKLLASAGRVVAYDRTWTLVEQ